MNLQGYHDWGIFYATRKPKHLMTVRDSNPRILTLNIFLNNNYQFLHGAKIDHNDILKKSTKTT